MEKGYKSKAVQLAKIMNTKSTFSVPVIDVIIECFEIVFTETDVDRLILVGKNEYTKEQLIRLWNLKGEEAEKYMEYIIATGALWPRREVGVYELAPIFPGWIEIYASGPETDRRRQLIKKFSEFEDVLKKLNVLPVRAYMNRVNSNYVAANPGRMSTIVTGKRSIKVGKSIDAENAVMLSQDLKEMLEKHREHISVMNCFCRMMKKLEDKKCDFDMPIEGCIAVGRMSDMLVETGISKPLTYDEAVSLMDSMEKKGCIHTVYHYGITSKEDELIICNCCTDCCFLYSSYREGALSQLIMKAYYTPEVVSLDECTGCNLCGKFCPTKATYYDKIQKKLIYDKERCIGCGQCVTQCGKSVRTMVGDERSVFVKTLSRKEAENA